MQERVVALARRWVDAYAGRRDEEMLELAHPEIVIRPRRGQGRREYAGLRSWLADAETRHVPDDLRITATDDGRPILELEVDDVPIVAVLSFRDDKVAEVQVYLSDRDLLRRLGAIA